MCFTLLPNESVFEPLCELRFIRCIQMNLPILKLISILDQANCELKLLLIAEENNSGNNSQIFGANKELKIIRFVEENPRAKQREATFCASYRVELSYPFTRFITIDCRFKPACWLLLAEGLKLHLSGRSRKMGILDESHTADGGYSISAHNLKESHVGTQLFIIHSPEDVCLVTPAKRRRQKLKLSTIS